MFDGFVNVAAATVDIHVADCDYNAGKIMECIKRGPEGKGKGNRFSGTLHNRLYMLRSFFRIYAFKWRACSSFKIAAFSADIDMFAIVGLPIMKDSKLYNCAAVLKAAGYLALCQKLFFQTTMNFTRHGI